MSVMSRQPLFFIWGLSFTVLSVSNFNLVIVLPLPAQSKSLILHFLFPLFVNLSTTKYAICFLRIFLLHRNSMSLVIYLFFLTRFAIKFFLEGFTFFLIYFYNFSVIWSPFLYIDRYSSI